MTQYGVDARLRGRLDELATHFASRYHRDPSFFVRVPGRVNLIGEHVDYCGYSVCPMAIEQDVLVAVGEQEKEEDVLRLTNVDQKYPDYRHERISDISECRLDDEDLGPSWHRYFLCGVKGALGVIPQGRWPRSILAAVWGNVPPNAGLSSSSALVSAALLATVRLSEHVMSKEEMATLSASAERHIGTQGGGMDQAIAFLARAGSAKLIEFNPLRGFDVTLPDDGVFVIAHSLADHNKAATSDFNTRVLECRLAAQVIAGKRGVEWRTVQKLIDVQRSLGKTLEEMADVVATELHEEPYTLEEVCRTLGTTEDELKSISNIRHNTSRYLKLQQRALHVFQALGGIRVRGSIKIYMYPEANRVGEFREVCERRDLEASDQLRQLGRLMSASHRSLRELYECSHPRIDDLVRVAIECGALGARLTGAGWGGCVVAITTSDKVVSFVDGLKQKFYENDEQAKGLDLSKFVFKTEPKEGAAIYDY